MRKLKYLAIVLMLVEVILVAGLVYDVLAARETASASSYLPVYDAARVEESDAATYGPFWQAAHSLDGGYLADRWGVSKIDAPQAWHITRGDQLVMVAVLDTDINRDNQNLADRVVAEVNFTGSPTSDDLQRRGTHMAGTIVAIAPECQLSSFKTRCVWLGAA